MAVSFTYFPLISQKESLPQHPQLGDSFRLKCKPRGNLFHSPPLPLPQCVWQARRRPAKDLLCLSQKTWSLAGCCCCCSYFASHGALSFGNAKHFRRATRTINCCGKVLSVEKFRPKFRCARTFI